MSKHILLVDDDMNLLSAIDSYLSDEGFLVDTVPNVKLALKFLYQKKPDLIITDIMMPDSSGYDLIEILRNDISLANLPVIFLTARGMTSDRIKGYDLGCNAYISKPFDPNELISIIKSLFSNIDLMQADFSPVQPEVLPSSNFIAYSFADLTHRELTVLKLVVKGLMNKEIALKLDLSLRNVEKYVSRLLSKTNTRNRTELSKAVWQKNFLSSEGE